MILHCIDILREGMDSLKKMMRYKDYDIDSAKQHMDRMLKSFEELLGQSLPPLPEKVAQVTELDKHMRKLRVQELEALYTECKLMPIHQMMVKIEEYIEQLQRMAKVLLYKQECKIIRSYLHIY
jgi:hypothetical protein